jgi:adenylate cyclase
MPIEIERKFLLKNDAWKVDADAGTRITQGYLSSNPERSVRIRTKGDKGILTIKSKTTDLSRKEFEYPIPIDEAKELLSLCEKPFIDKTRYVVHHRGHDWEVDIFHAENEGLCIAEIELSNEEESFQLPSWVGEEVSEDAAYYNMNLAKHPYIKWGTPSEKD